MTETDRAILQRVRDNLELALNLLPDAMELPQAWYDKQQHGRVTINRALGGLDALVEPRNELNSVEEALVSDLEKVDKTLLSAQDNLSEEWLQDARMDIVSARRMLAEMRRYIEGRNTIQKVRPVVVRP